MVTVREELQVRHRPTREGRVLALGLRAAATPLSAPAPTSAACLTCSWAQHCLPSPAYKTSGAPSTGLCCLQELWLHW